LHHLRPGQHRCRPAGQAHRGSLHGHRDIDLNGILGLNADVRNGYEKITVRFTIKGDAPAEKLREIVEQSRRYDSPQARIPGARRSLACSTSIWASCGLRCTMWGFDSVIAS
jgi:hypothetical protein